MPQHPEPYAEVVVTGIGVDYPGAIMVSTSSYEDKVAMRVVMQQDSMTVLLSPDSVKDLAAKMVKVAEYVAGE